MPAFGSLCIHLALLASALATPVFLRAGGRGGLGLRSARALAGAAAALLTAALSLLALAAVAHDFRIEYVASYTDRSTDIEYLATAVWAGQAGSLLVWACLLAWVPVILGPRLRAHAPALEPVALGALTLLACFFDAILAGWSNPFVILEGRALVDGNGLNPLLRNALMVLHPPALLAGYVAYAAPAAITVAALARGKLDRVYLRELRRWALVAWVLLTVGNVLGMAWAYGELGWGGYWGWDPVENASLIPWLVGTALLHVILAEERAGAAKGWSAPLSLLTFWLTILGTWLTRSGVVASVHAFGRTAVGTAFGVLLAVTGVAVLAVLVWRFRLISWPSRRILLPTGWVAGGLTALAVTDRELGGETALIAGPALITVAAALWAFVPGWRKDFARVLAAYVVTAAAAGALEPSLWLGCAVGFAGLVTAGLVTRSLEGDGVAALVSRRTLLPAATVLVMALAGGVLIGTLLPLGSQLVVGQPAQVGPPWYNDWAAPAGLVLLSLTVLCVGLGARKPSLRAALRRLSPPLGGGLVGAGVAWSQGVTNPLALGAVGLGSAAALAALIEGGRAIGAGRSRKGEGGRARVAGRLGAVLAHLGVAVLFFGISGEAGKLEEDLVLERGSAARLGDATFRLEDISQRMELNRRVLEAEVVVVQRPGAPERRLTPARHRYRTHAEQPTSEAAWITDLRGDLFVALGRVDLERGQVGVRAVMTPLLPWIWVGSTLLALGGLLAVLLLLRPSRRTLFAVVATAAGVTALWFLWSPSIAFSALAALSVGLTVVWLAVAFILPLWKLEPGPPAKAPRRCPKCEAKLISDSAFCHKCGAKIGGEG